jgi:hypothetical protein
MTHGIEVLVRTNSGAAGQSTVNQQPRSPNVSLASRYRPLTRIDAPLRCIVSHRLFCEHFPCQPCTLIACPCLPAGYAA